MDSGATPVRITPRRIGARPTRARRWSVVSAVVLFVWTLTTHGKPSVSGDEPHYLIVSESIVADHDLDLDNNYRADDSRQFGHDMTDPDLHARRNRAGALWSTHDIGLPVLLVPIYAAATRLSLLVPVDFLARFRQTKGLLAYSIISFSLILLTAFGASLMLTALTGVVSAGRALVIVLTLVLSPPVVAHAFLVFPECPAFAVVCGVVWLISRRDEELTLHRVAAVLLAVGCMPWLHRKYSFFTFGLLFIMVKRHRAWFASQSAGRLAVFGVLFAVPQAALHLFTLWAWGHLGGPQMLEGLPFSLGRVAAGSLGLLADRESGLIAYAPIYLIAPACAFAVWRRQWDVAVPLLLLFLPMAAYVDWRGGYAPAARYLVPLTPLVAFAVAPAFSHRWLARIAIVLLVFQVAIDGYVWQHPRAMWPHGVGTNRALEAIPIIGPAYERLLPSFPETVP